MPKHGVRQHDTSARMNAWSCCPVDWRLKVFATFGRPSCVCLLNFFLPVSFTQVAWSIGFSLTIRSEKHSHTGVLAALHQELVPPLGRGSLYLRPLLLGSGALLGLGPAPSYTFVVYAAAVGAYFKVGASRDICRMAVGAQVLWAPAGMSAPIGSKKPSAVCSHSAPDARCSAAVSSGSCLVVQSGAPKHCGLCPWREAVFLEKLTDACEHCRVASWTRSTCWWRSASTARRPAATAPSRPPATIPRCAARHSGHNIHSRHICPDFVQRQPSDPRDCCRASLQRLISVQ